MERPCKKCLLAQSAMQDVFEAVQEQIRALPEDERTSEKEYSRRLALCTGCESLTSGMCQKCGCFAELRAARKRAGCPDVPAKWSAEE